jgi:uncharacterized membrane protein YhdT
VSDNLIFLRVTFQSKEDAEWKLGEIVHVTGCAVLKIGLKKMKTAAVLIFFNCLFLNCLKIVLIVLIVLIVFRDCLNACSPDGKTAAIIVASHTTTDSIGVFP